MKLRNNQRMCKKSNLLTDYQILKVAKHLDRSR